MKFLSLDRTTRLRSRWVIQRPGRTPPHRLRPQRQRRTVGGEFLASRGMTEGRGKKVASPPLRLGGRGEAGPGQIKPMKRSWSGRTPRKRDLLSAEVPDMRPGITLRTQASIDKTEDFVTIGALVRLLRPSFGCSMAGTVGRKPSLIMHSYAKNMHCKRMDQVTEIQPAPAALRKLWNMRRLRP